MYVSKNVYIQASSLHPSSTCFACSLPCLFRSWIHTSLSLSVSCILFILSSPTDPSCRFRGPLLQKPSFISLPPLSPLSHYHSVLLPAADSANSLLTVLHAGGDWMGTGQGAACSGLSFLSTSWNPCLIYPHLRALLVLRCEVQGSVCSLEMLREGKNLSSPLWLTLIHSFVHSFIHSAHVSGGRQPCSHIWLPQSHVVAEIRATKEEGIP